MQGNLANSYSALGRQEQALQLQRDVYSGRLKIHGNEDFLTFSAASNLAASLYNVQRFEEAKSLLRKTIPVARRVLGEGDSLTLKMRWIYATALSNADSGVTLDDLREAVKTFVETRRIARRVLGSEHPSVVKIKKPLRCARAKLFFAVCISCGRLR